MLLKNKNILLGVSASIAIYKSLELIRLYIKEGANVRVILSKDASQFISALTFEAISQNIVLDDSTQSWDKTQDYNHIDIGKWADIFIIVPCSANTINKLANGIADNLLTQSILAYKKTKIICPAANTNMIQNDITQKSIIRLKKLKFRIIATQNKELICKDFGDGAMADIEEIFYISTREILKTSYWNKRNVILSGGGSIEKIDDVRYISNFSSGKMANALALALYYKGANITLVASRGYENLPKDIEILKSQSSAKILQNLQKTIVNMQDKKSLKKTYLFMLSAISDYIPETYQKGKLKKEELGTSWNLKLKQNVDILSSLNKKHMISIGFKAEMNKNEALVNAKNMLKNKKLDAVCLNILDEDNTFGLDTNNIKLLFKNSSFEFKGNKLIISLEILKKLKKEFKNYD